MASAINGNQFNKPSVLIVGAGIAGLMTALECRRHGFDVRILEKAPSNSSLGDSFAIGSSGLTTFKHYPELEKRRAAIAADPFFTMCGPTGEQIKGPMDMGQMLSKEVTREHGWVYRYRRPQFAAILLDELKKTGVQVEYGTDAVDYFEDEAAKKAGVVLKDGTKILADLVVAADGRRSRSWALVEGQPVPARSSGHAIFRCVVPAEDALADQEIAKRFPLVEGRASIQMWFAPGLRAVFTRYEDTIEFALDHPDVGTADESWGSKVPVEEMFKLSATVPGWPAEADRLWSMAPGGKVVDWKLMWRDAQEKWTSPGGRVVQIGDAAHAFLPTSGNGGTQALEDAISLVECLAIAGRDGIPEATRVHNLLRFERVSYLMAYGVANQWARETKTGKDAKLLHSTLGAWILLHDPVQYARDNFEKAREHVLSGASFKNTNTPPGAVYRPWTFESLCEALEKGKPSIMDGDWS